MVFTGTHTLKEKCIFYENAPFMDLQFVLVLNTETDLGAAPKNNTNENPYDFLIKVLGFRLFVHAPSSKSSDFTDICR